MTLNDMSHRDSEDPCRRPIEEDMLLAILSLVAGGGLLGVTCARAVPSAVTIEVSLAVVSCVLLVTLCYAGKVPVRRAAADARAVVPRRGVGGGRTLPDAVGASFSSSDSDVSAEPEPPSPTRSLPRDERRASPAPASSKGMPPPAAITVPIHLRVEEEKRRLSLAGGAAKDGARAKAYCLRFPDAMGRQVKYTVRSSRKSNAATFLELAVEGERTRKVKGLVYDALSRAIHDGKRRFVVPSQDVAVVTKSLSLLCKVCSVPLEYVCAAEEPQTVSTRVSKQSPSQ